MGAADRVIGQAPAALITSALGDLGNLVRRNQAQSLDHDTFLELVRDMRRKLKAARIACDAGLDVDELQEVGDVLGRLLNSGMLRRGSALQRPALPEGASRARYTGHLTVIDGGLNRPMATPSEPKPTGA